jgi:hypothetical protein
MLLSIALLGSIYFTPSLPAQTHSQPSVTVNHSSGYKPLLLCSEEADCFCDGEAYCCDPETGEGCEMPPESHVATCDVTLYYRSVNITNSIPSGGSHAFWYWEDSPLSAVLDAGPSGTFPNLGYLNDYFAFGHQGHLAPDSTATATSAGSINSTAACTMAGKLDAFYDTWPNNTTEYYVTGPNSNTWASRAGAHAGIPTVPPLTVWVPGWGQ